MLGVFFTESQPRIVDTDDPSELWDRILEFKNALRGKLEESEVEGSVDFIGLQDERGQVFLLALYDKNRWALETLEKDWNTLFGKMDLAGDFSVNEALLNDNELKATLEQLMSEG